MNAILLLQKSQRITQQWLDLLFPPRCAGCRRSGHVLCADCVRAIPLLQPPFCQHCGSPSAVSGLCQACRYHAPRLHGLRAVSVFEEPLRAYIHALKYNGNTRLAEPLGRLLAQAYIRNGFQVDTIIAVPLHPERQRQRGYNHAQLLAEVCASLVGVPLSHDIVQRQRVTAAQVGLSASQRLQNMAGAFVCTPAISASTGALRGRRILIIDDVCTTGATIEACAAPLYAAGAAAVLGLVLARPL